jgi:hypothetical protein
LTVLPRQSYPPGYDPLFQMYPDLRASPAPLPYSPTPDNY